MIQTSNSDRPADVLVHGARIATLDAERPSATAIAIRDGLVLATGSDSEIRVHEGPRTQRIDAGGRSLIAGLNECVRTLQRPQTRRARRLIRVSQ